MKRKKRKLRIKKSKIMDTVFKRKSGPMQKRKSRKKQKQEWQREYEDYL